MANQFYPVLPRIADTNGNPVSGAKLRFFVTGTTTPMTVYTTEAADVAHPSPLIAGADGSLPAIWVPTGAAKAVVTDAADATLFTIDPVVATSAAGQVASDVSFSPTAELPFTDVQAAIVGAAESAASGYAAFGIGITGSATLLAALDATNIGAGTYRFDGTTTGTYPTGVAAADAGIVEHWRQASGAAMQMLYHATTDRIFHRRMAASVWGTWRENVTVNQGAAQGDILYRTATAWARLPKGTALQVLRQNAALTAPEWATAAGETLLTQQVTTSGATFSFTIPTSATVVTFMFDGTSLSGTGNYLVQLSTSAAYVTSGYDSVSSVSATAITVTTGMVIIGVSAANALRGTMTLRKMSDNKWLATHTGYLGTGGDGSVAGSGIITLGGAIDGIRVTTSAGTFDLGAVNVSYS